VFGATRDAVTVSRVTRPGVGGSFDGIRWVKGLLLAVITICAVAGIVSTAALGQTQARPGHRNRRSRVLLQGGLLARD